MLLDIARTNLVMLPWTMPVPPVRPPPPATANASPAVRSVLLVDDDVSTLLLAETMIGKGTGLEVIATDDPWTALDHLASNPPDLVLCGASLRAGRTPLFRLFWTAHPELKARFVLIVSPDDLHAPLTPARQRIAVQRPITADVITEALRRLGRL
jgi:DNA-binding NarL/FixJ family response regulator